AAATPTAQEATQEAIPKPGEETAPAQEAISKPANVIPAAQYATQDAIPKLEQSSLTIWEQWPQEYTARSSDSPSGRLATAQGPVTVVDGTQPDEVSTHRYIFVVPMVVTANINGKVYRLTTHYTIAVCFLYLGLNL
ncbi:unnamed protein product, partial [Haemonchus placei]|uniref:SURF1-like protein n=1 Tax=Haemonchus placei TaxID=6290 RepID=A0A158QKG8_HAEPC